MRLYTYIAIALAVTGGVGYFLFQKQSAPAPQEPQTSIVSPDANNNTPPSTDNAPSTPPPETTTADVASPQDSKDNGPTVVPDAPANIDLAAVMQSMNASPVASQFMQSENINDKILSLMDDACQGSRPTAALAMFMPREKFTVEPSPINAGDEVISNASIARFQPLLDALLAIPPTTMAQCYKIMEPELQKAYSNGGYNYGSLREMVNKFLDTIINMPAYNFNPRLKKMPCGNYMYADEPFESLNDFQKLLTRLGYANLDKLKKYCAQIKKELK